MIFQTVIDKVLVHRGLTTLEVMVVGSCPDCRFRGRAVGPSHLYVLAHHQPDRRRTRRPPVSTPVAAAAGLFRRPAGRRQRRAGARAREPSASSLPVRRITLVLDLAFSAVFLGVMFLYSRLALCRGSAPAALCVVVDRHHAGLPPASRREIPARRREPGVPGRERHRRRDASRPWRSSRRCSTAGRSSSQAMSVLHSASQVGNWASQTVQLINKMVTARMLFLGASSSSTAT